MKWSCRRTLALALVSVVVAGCSNQYEDVGSIDVASSKAKSAESGTARGGDPPKKASPNLTPGHSSAASTSGR